MSESRRDFLTQTSLGLLGVAAALRTQESQPANLPPGTPPAFGTAPAVGPEVSPATFAEAQKLVQVELTLPERSMAARSWRSTMAGLYERRTGPRKVGLEPALAPWSRWDAVPPGQKAGPDRESFVRSKNEPGPLPAGKDHDLHGRFPGSSDSSPPGVSTVHRSMGRTTPGQSPTYSPRTPSPVLRSATWNATASRSSAWTTVGL